MILLLLRTATALDAHGAPAAPGVGSDAASPLIVPEAGTPATGGAVTFEAARKLAMAWPVDGSAPSPVLDDLFGLELGGGWRLGRVGVTASLPMWFHGVGKEGSFDGLFLGDLRVAVPWTAYAGKDLSLTLRGEAVAPTGAEGRLLGGGWGGGLHAVVGRTGPGLTWSLGTGVALDTDAKWENVDRTLSVPLGGQVGYSAGIVGGGLEAWFSPSLSAETVPLASSPGEALARFGVRTHGGVAASLAGGYAIAPGVGSAGPRVMLRIGWSEPEKAKSGTAVSEPGTAGPGDVVVRATDAAGKPVDATVTVAGPTPVEPVHLGRDGEAILPLGPGEWTISLEAPGKETQSRAVVVGADEWRPTPVDAVLPTSERGAEKLVLHVVDVTGKPVPGAEVRLDDVSRGETSTGGSVTLESLDAGERSLVVSAPGFVATNERIPLDGAERTVVLAAEPGTVRVVARAGDTAAARAQVRFIGPGELRPPVPLGDDGEELVQLAPGHWTAVVTAPDLGMQEREVDVEPGATAVLLVDVRLAATGGDATLGVRVLDPAGRPVVGAAVELDGAAVGTTSSGGALRLGGLATGDHLLTAHGDLLRPADLRVALAGPRDVDLVLGWAPGTLAVRTRGPDGEPVDAAVRFAGRLEQAPGTLGADGEALYSLPAGDWRVAVSAASFGLQERAVRVEPDAVARVDIDASLLREAGNADLVVTVHGPDGADVSAAEIRVDGRDAGTIGGTGIVRLSGLAPGKHQLVVNGGDSALGRWEKELQLGEGANATEVKLGWADRAVRVKASGPAGPVADGIARGFGPGSTPVTPLGADGQAVLGLDARSGWAVAVSSGALGVLSAPVPATRTNPAEMEMRFAPAPAGKSRLMVELEGPDGSPVSGTLRAGDGKPVRIDGALVLTDLAPGPLKLQVEAEGFTAVKEDLVLLDGDQARRVRLTWVPRAVHLTVADSAGKPVDAEVRLAGPGDVRPGSTGADGTLDTRVVPGDWQVLVSAPDYGARSVTAHVPPGAEPFPVAVTLEAARVEVTAAAVEIDESIHFAFDSATIEPESRRVIEEIAGVLQLHPEIARVEIQGHTDDRGLAVYNLDLSQRRADAVRAALIEAGVAAERLTAKGYGATVPVAPNTSEAGRQKNRRVQMIIVERAG